MANLIPERSKVSPFFLFFLIPGMQVGVGVFGFPRYLADEAGFDSWLAVIITGISTSVIIWLVFIILKRGGGDIIEIHRNTFGKWIGGFISFLMFLYLFSFSLVILRTYTEVIQIWIFPDLSTWSITLAYCILAYYAVIKGFRVVTGLSFFAVIISFLAFSSLIGPLEYIEVRNLLPLLDHSIPEYLTSAKTMVLGFLGVKMLFIYYPFIKKPDKAVKWAIGGNVFTLVVYLFVVLAAFVFYSPGQLQKTVWPLFTMWQIIELPFIERFEYLAIPAWGAVILSGVCLALWVSSRGFRLLFSFNQKQTLIVLLLIVFSLSVIFQTREAIDRMNTVTAEIGFYFTYIYIPILWLIQSIRKKGSS